MTFQQVKDQNVHLKRNISNAFIIIAMYKSNDILKSPNIILKQTLTHQHYYNCLT